MTLNNYILIDSNCENFAIKNKKAHLMAMITTVPLAIYFVHPSVRQLTAALQDVWRIPLLLSFLAEFYFIHWLGQILSLRTTPWRTKPLKATIGLAIVALVTVIICKAFYPASKLEARILEVIIAFFPIGCFVISALAFGLNFIDDQVKILRLDIRR